MTVITRIILMALITIIFCHHNDFSKIQKTVFGFPDTFGRYRIQTPDYSQNSSNTNPTALTSLAVKGILMPGFDERPMIYTCRRMIVAVGDGNGAMAE